MGAFATYTFSAGIYLLTGYLIYKWLLSTENQPMFNRIVLLILYAAAFVMPVLPEFNLFRPTGGTLISIDVLIEGAVAEAATPVGMQVPMWAQVLLWVYFAGIAVTAAMTLMALTRLIRIVRTGRCAKGTGYNLILLSGTNLAPFSWLRYIVMKESDYREDGEMIICHERAHMRLGHWVDLILTQIAIVILWYNPASWLMRRELRNVHEYQADNEVLKSGINAREYQLLLIKKAVGQRFPSLANSLNHSKLKTRITMMCNQPGSPSRRLRALAVAPALVLAAAVMNVPSVASALETVSTATLTMDKGNENLSTVQPASPVVEDEVAKAADEYPQFPGGEVEMMNYLAKNTHYPDDAIQAGWQGCVVVQFVVMADGSIANASILKSPGESLSAEAIRVVESMPRWIPGKKEGKAVNCGMVLPVLFKLSDDEDKPEVKANSPLRLVGSGTIKKGKNGEETLVFKAPTYNIDQDMTIFVDGKLYKGDINSLNPEEIESITVRKDSPEHPDGVIDIKMKKSTPTYKVDQKVTIFVDGKLYDGDINSINTEEVESITVRKDSPEYPDGVIDIKMKK